MGATEDAARRRFAAVRSSVEIAGRATEPGRAPSVEDAFEAVPATLAQTRLTRGTRERLLSAASFRT
jgi:hypothetical protein